MRIPLILFVLVLSTLILPSQTEFGIDIGQPINVGTGDLNPGTDTTILGDICASWVRVNFILGPWTSPADQTLHSGRTWQQAYNEIINRLVAKGIQVYGLIGAEAYTYPVDTLEQYPGPDSAAAVSWISNYTYNFVQIVDMFKDRVRVFESFNEPNNWTNSSTAIVHPAWMALMQQEIYLNTKYFNGHASDSLWQVTMISGALFTFDGNTGSQYIADEYWYGKNHFAWDWTYSTFGTYPVDGFGQHLYVAQGDSDVTTISNAMNYNISDFRSGAYQYETDVNKKNFISEFGWESNTYGESFQALNLTTSFNVLQFNSDVQLALWFTLSDFPGGEWGLYYFGNLLPADQKQSYHAFRNYFNCPTIGTGVQTTKPSDHFTLLISGENYFLRGSAGGEVTIKVYDLIGRAVRTFQMKGESQKNIVLELEGLSSGNYIIQVTEGSRTEQLQLPVY